MNRFIISCSSISFQDMDNIHSMASKVLNYTKKANIRYLKCQKCNVEKKSALGYMSHVEVSRFSFQQHSDERISQDDR